MFIGSFVFIISVNGSKIDVNVDNFEEVLVVLNCMYVEEDGEIIDGGCFIIWCSFGFDGKNIVGFLKLGGDGYIFYLNGEYFWNCLKFYNFMENLISVLIVIENVLCGDDKWIFYCYIKYLISDGFYEV